jgi:phosphonate degradation associated HDIG domain protein
MHLSIEGPRQKNQSQSRGLSLDQAWLAVHHHLMNSTHADAIDFILAFYAKYSDQAYIGENISQLEHALQSAHLARQASASEELIAAALLHDIGHLNFGNEDFKNSMDGYGTVGHERIGARLVRELGFPQAVADLIIGHVEAKRFLVFKHPSYLQNLSHASLETLKRQGGPMTGEEAASFEANPLHKDMLRLRAWDDQAKVENWEVPALTTYVGLLQNLLSTSDEISVRNSEL